MTIEYTPSQIREILKKLDIEPYRTHLIDGRQATKILTWRLKEEKGIEREYTMTALRRRVSTGALPVPERISDRLNLYDMRDVFELSLMPQKAEGTKHRIEKKEDTSEISS